MAEQRLDAGAQVAFRLADAVCPDFEQIVAQLCANLMVTGEVVLLSDHDRKKEQYAVVNVAGINPPLIVPARSLSAFMKRERIAATKA